MKLGLNTRPEETDRETAAEGQPALPATVWERIDAHLPTRVLSGTLFLASILSFVTASSAQYRGRDGLLGRTVPPWQEAILDGTAPAPYVYRQGVPRLRSVAESFLLPGHAAVAVDTFFAVIAILAVSIVVVRWAGAFWPLAMPVAAFACLAVYPNDKPEAVAAVASLALITACGLHRGFWLAAGVAALSASIRPEFPILLGLGMVGAWILMGRPSLSARHRLPALAVLVVGVAYLVAARFLWWPDATYPPGIHPFALPHNLTTLSAYPADLLVLAVIACAILWARESLRVLPPGEVALAERAFELGLALFVVLFAVASLLLAHVEEIRMYEPLVPVLLAVMLPRFVGIDPRSGPQVAPGPGHGADARIHGGIDDVS